MIFYEKEYAEFILKNGFSSFMSFEDLSILAKYFKYLGKNKPQIRKSLIEFCEKYNDDFNEVLAREKIDSAISVSQKYRIRLKRDVVITKSEMDVISTVPGYKNQKILFVMLAVAKYYKENDTRIKEKPPTKYDDNYYLDGDIIPIIKLAKVNMNKKDRISFIYSLEQSDIIETTRVGSMKINFVDNTSGSAIVIDNMNKVADFFPLFCERCGKIMEKRAKRHGMCEECYLEYRNIARKY